MKIANCIVTPMAGVMGGTRDGWNAPGGGVLNFAFYKERQALGVIGITPSSDNQVFLSVGTLSRRAPSDEIVALLKRLDVAWPDRWPPKVR